MTITDEDARALRRRMMAAWEDLVEAQVPARLGMRRKGVFEIDLSSGALGVINRVCETHGLDAEAAPFGVTLTPGEVAVEEVLGSGT